MNNIRRQELYCHGCDNYVQFDVDLSLDGNHFFYCPVCNHTHYRVVENGRITDIRPIAVLPSVVIDSTGITYSTASTYVTCGKSCATETGSTYLYQSWLDTTGKY